MQLILQKKIETISTKITTNKPVFSPIYRKQAYGLSIYDVPESSKTQASIPKSQGTKVRIITQGMKIIIQITAYDAIS